jgi:hypothetical protein
LEDILGFGRMSTDLEKVVLRGAGLVWREREKGRKETEDRFRWNDRNATHGVIEGLQRKNSI